MSRPIFPFQMPIPEPGRYRPSNLTKQQQREQLAACYGVPMPQELSYEEVERMRQIIAQHDSQRQPMQTIDLNNPPRQPYRFQKFPMMLYGPTVGARMIVHSEDALESALAEGWQQEAPVTLGEREEPLSAAYQSEVSQIQRQIEETKRRGPGRPRSNEAA
jgi:hypothetical protein